ncbi:MAG: hypothetical protein P4L31_01345 [Candidatus Babeliales bacterium]|nr:hypothetical protein [Candidatus Babeliales bacterium]
MSVDHFIEIKLAADYSSSNIYKILKDGAKAGFVYHDQIWGKDYEDAPILNEDQATTKVMLALKNNADEGPCVFAKIEESYCNLYFFKNGENLDFHLGGFRWEKTKLVEGRSYIDFDYYIRLALDLCKDFAFLELKTDTL